MYLIVNDKKRCSVVGRSKLDQFKSDQTCGHSILTDFRCFGANFVWSRIMPDLNLYKSFPCSLRGFILSIMFVLMENKLIWDRAVIFFMCFGRFKIDAFSGVRGNFRLDPGTSGLKLFGVAPKHTPKWTSNGPGAHHFRAAHAWRTQK